MAVKRVFEVSINRLVIRRKYDELPRDISGKAMAMIRMVWSWSYSLVIGRMDSRQALQILESRCPISPELPSYSVFALSPANLEPVLKSVSEKFAGPEGNAEIEKFKKEFASHLWIAVMTQNRGLQSATEVLTRVQLTTPITALQGYTSTGYAKMAVKEGGIGKEAASVNWNYIEPAITAVTLIGVQPKDFAGKVLISERHAHLVEGLQAIL